VISQILPIGEPQLAHVINPLTERRREGAGGGGLEKTALMLAFSCSNFNLIVSRGLPCCRVGAWIAP
jgi:hypothetical protein